MIRHVIDVERVGGGRFTLSFPVSTPHATLYRLASELERCDEVRRAHLDYKSPAAVLAHDMQTVDTGVGHAGDV